MCLHTHNISFKFELIPPRGRGVHPPKGNNAFVPCFRFPSLFPEIFSDSMENFQNVAFFQKNFFSVHQNFCSDDLFLVIETQFATSPQFVTFPRFQKINTFLPVLEKTSFPLLLTISPCFHFNLCLFCLLYIFFLPSVLTMMHSCITQYTYWMPLPRVGVSRTEILPRHSLLSPVSSFFNQRSLLT